MTLCNMVAIRDGRKAGGRAGRNHLQLRTRPSACMKGKDFDDAVAYWKTLKTDDGATF